MGFLDKLINGSRTKTINLGVCMDNVLITGDSTAGKSVVMNDYTIDALNRNYGIIIFRNHMSPINAYSIVKSPRYIYTIDCSENATTDSIDIFNGLSERDICSYILKIFDAYSDIPPECKMKYLNYIMLMRDLIRKSGKKNVKLSELVNYPIEKLEDFNLKYVTNPNEQLKNDRFLGTMRAEIIALESYFSVFATNTIGEIFSGVNGIEQILNKKPVIEVSMDFAVKQKESELVMTSIIDAINRCSVSATGRSNIAIIVDGVNNDSLINSGLDRLITGNQDFKVAYSIQDINNLSEKSNSWIDFADTYLFFRQTSTKNKEYCSLFFDTYEKQKVSYTSGSSNPSFFDRLAGRGAATYSRNTTTTTEKERVYPPEVFSGLKDNEAIYYDKKNNEHLRLTVF